MSAAEKVITQVYQLPANEADRKNFLEGIKALASEFKATWIAGSVHHEMDYAELLEQELAGEIGDFGVEALRQKFERK